MQIEEQQKYEHYKEIRYLHNGVLCTCYSELVKKR